MTNLCAVKLVVIQNKHKQKIPPRSEERRFLDFVRKYQLDLRAVIGDEEAGLKGGDLRILTALAQNDGEGLTDLPKSLAIPHSTYLRALKRLTAHKLIHKRETPRSRTVQVTDSGHELANRYAHKLAEAFLVAQSRLNSSEVLRLETLLGSLADGFSVPPLRQSGAIAPLRQQVMRVGRGVGTFGNRALHQPGLAVLYWLVIAEVAGSPTPPTVTELKDRITILASTLHEQLSRLLQKGFITRRDDPSDRRRTLIDITDAGRAFVENLELVHERRHQRAWKGMSSEERFELLELTQKFVGISTSSSNLTLQPALSLMPIRESKDLNLFRRFLYEGYYRLHTDQVVPERMMPSSAKVFGIQIAGKPVALVEFSKLTHGWQVEHFLRDDTCITAELATRFLAEAIKLLPRLSAAPNFEIGPAVSEKEIVAALLEAL